MKCNEKLILDYFEGFLEESGRRKLLSHLEDCADCRQAFDQYGQLFDIMKNTALHVPAGPRAWLIPRWAAVAAVILIGFLGISASLLIRQTTRQYHQLTAMNEQVRDLSSVLMLNAFDRLPASTRMQTLDMLNGQPELSAHEVEMLTATLRSDESLNVRSVAVRILVQHLDRFDIREVLYETLLKQQDPFLQVTLIRNLNRNQDERFVRALRELSASGEVIGEVKEEARRVLNTYQ